MHDARHQLRNKPVLDRLRLWLRHLPPDVPRDDDLDLGFLARRFRISGGNVRNICLAGAYLAAAEDRSLCMADLIHGTAREYQKLGRLDQAIKAYLQAKMDTEADLLAKQLKDLREEVPAVAPPPAVSVTACRPSLPPAEISFPRLDREVAQRN